MELTINKGEREFSYKDTNWLSYERGGDPQTTPINVTSSQLLGHIE